MGRDDFGASQGAKSAHTGSMEATSHAGAAQNRPALPNCTGYVVTDPNLFLFWTEEFFAFTENSINGLCRARIKAEPAGFQAS